jgi:hypothetical protein
MPTDSPENNVVFLEERCFLYDNMSDEQLNMIKAVLQLLHDSGVKIILLASHLFDTNHEGKIKWIEREFPFIQTADRENVHKEEAVMNVSQSVQAHYKKLGKDTPSPLHVLGSPTSMQEIGWEDGGHFEVRGAVPTLLGESDSGGAAAAENSSAGKKVECSDAGTIDQPKFIAVILLLDKSLVDAIEYINSLDISNKLKQGVFQQLIIKAKARNVDLAIETTSPFGKTVRDIFNQLDVNTGFSNNSSLLSIFVSYVLIYQSCKKIIAESGQQPDNEKLKNMVGVINHFSALAEKPPIDEKVLNFKTVALPVLKAMYLAGTVATAAASNEFLNPTISQFDLDNYTALISALVEMVNIFKVIAILLASYFLYLTLGVAADIVNFARKKCFTSQEIQINDPVVRQDIRVAQEKDPMLAEQFAAIVKKLTIRTDISSSSSERVLFDKLNTQLNDLVTMNSLMNNQIVSRDWYIQNALRVPDAREADIAFAEQQFKIAQQERLQTLIYIVDSVVKLAFLGILAVTTYFTVGYGNDNFDATYTDDSPTSSRDDLEKWSLLAAQSTRLFVWSIAAMVIVEKARPYIAPTLRLFDDIRHGQYKVSCSKQPTPTAPLVSVRAEANQNARASVTTPLLVSQRSPGVFGGAGRAFECCWPSSRSPRSGVQ